MRLVLPDRKILQAAVLGMVIAGLVWSAPGRAAGANGMSSSSRALNEILSATQMHNIPLRDAIAYLRNTTNANIFVNWNALQAAGVSRMAPVSLDVRNVTVRKVLSLILAEASPQTPLVFFISSNVLTITTRSEANLHLVTRVYPVGDLIMSVPNFNNAPSFNLQSATQNTSSSVSSQGGGGAMGAAGGGLFTGSTAATSNTQASAKRKKELVKLIETVISPRIWSVNGGPANIIYFNRQLVVTAPAYIQELIGGPG